MALALVAAAPPAHAGPEDEPLPTVYDTAAAPFTYTKATTIKCTCPAPRTGTYVLILPTGTATFQVSKTTSVSMSAYGTGGSYSVSVDGGPPAAYTTSSCSCWETDPLASSLSSGTHDIVFTNTSPAGIGPSGPINGEDVKAWQVDAGGSALQTSVYVNSTNPLISYSNVTFVSDPDTDSGTLAEVPAGGVVTFWVQNTAAVQLEVVDDGAKLHVSQSNKPGGWNFTYPNTGAYKQYHFTNWGLPPGLLMVTVSVTTGTLELDRVLLTQRSSLGAGSLVGAGTAGTKPMLGGFGDSVTVGGFTLGPNASSDGYMDQLASTEGYRLADVARGGTSAYCYGRFNTGSLVPYDPDRIIVAYGVNDMVGFGCHPTTEQFRSAMDSIITQLQAKMPGIPVYLGAILAAPPDFQPVVPQWNRVIEDEATLHGLLYLDPSPAIDPATDLRDFVHPNSSGAADMAGEWAAAVPWGWSDLSLAVTDSPDPVRSSQPLTYTFTVTNAGPDRATGVALTDVLPASAAFVSATPSQGTCAGTTTVICSLGTLSRSGSATVTLVVIPSSQGTLTNSGATVSWEGDAQTENNVATVVTQVNPPASPPEEMCPTTAARPCVFGTVPEGGTGTGAELSGGEHPPPPTAGREVEGRSSRTRSGTGWRAPA